MTHWRASCACNALMLGSPHEPLCSRAYRRGWRIAALLDRAFGPGHCADVHARWLMQKTARN